MAVSDMRERIDTLMSGVSGITATYDSPPHWIPNVSLPCAMTYLDTFTQENLSTGGDTDNQWRFVTELYVGDISTGAFTTLETITLAALAALRGDNTLNGTCEFITVEDGGSPDLVEREHIRYLVKRIVTIARSEET